ncbi:autophagy-type protein 22 [Flagelloscypha sp. PMI_526]|nr:autophagy-type protein 22 [Flagelloscypha sp. PMI_526]
MSTTYARRLKGWLSYAFASEVFAVVSLSTFLPLCLEQFARDNGYLLPDKTEPCLSMTIGSLYIYSISVFLQAITVISTGGIADSPGHRKTLLFAFAALGIVALNSYLPGLAKEAPEVQQLLLSEEEDNSEHEFNENDESEDANAPLIAGSTRTPTTLPPIKRAAYEAALSSATSRISSQGIALGYGAGIILLVLTIIPVRMLQGSTFSLRLAIGLSGIWWATFCIPAWFWLPKGKDQDHLPPLLAADGTLNITAQIIGAWKRLGGMLRLSEILKLRNTFKFLAAWFLLSDGFTTIVSTAVLFGKTTLHMPASSLIIVGALAPTFGIVGSLTLPVVQRRFKWSNLRALVTLVLIGSLIPAYGCLGFLPFFKTGDGGATFGGLTTPAEMYALAVVFGSVYGAFQGYARALYAELIPPGEEARWYALFSITDKSSSFLGPLIVGLIADGSGNIRYGFFFLVGMMWCAVPILLWVNVERG